MWVAGPSGVIDVLCALRGMLKCLFACVFYMRYMIWNTDVIVRMHGMCHHLSWCQGTDVNSFEFK